MAGEGSVRLDALPGLHRAAVAQLDEHTKGVGVRPRFCRHALPCHAALPKPLARR